MRRLLPLAFTALPMLHGPPLPAEGALRTLRFGVANAPGQVEDALLDIWTDWGQQGRIAGFRNETRPADRLLFWTRPEIEINLARDAGFEIFRMGVDWGRIMPSPHVFDESALRQYHSILRKIRKRGMKVHLTLMHHSVPRWLQREDGWLRDSAMAHFREFSHRIIEEFRDEVEAWMTFNEPNVFVALAYTAGLWPPGEIRGLTSFWNLGPFRGKAVAALDRMAEAHNELYSWAHGRFPGIRIGYAHNLAWYTGKSALDRIRARMVSNFMNWRFPERTRGHMDFFGFNYYGAEWIKGQGIDVDPEEEYSEAGRAVFPEGLIHLLREVQMRFSLPVMITENGMADRTDLLRPAYLIEHLRAVEKAREEGIPVEAWIHWTLSDNLEWSDGFCPKFGLHEVDRSDPRKRTPRPALLLLKKIMKEKKITPSMRAEAWDRVVRNRGKMRPFCRSADGIHGLAVPVERPISSRDWRLPERLTPGP